MFVLAQILSLIAIIVNIIAVELKHKKHILLTIGLANFLFVISYLLLNAYIGVLICGFHTIIIIINHLLEEKDKKTPNIVILLYLIFAITIGLITYKYIVDLLPIIASILFIFTLNIKEEKYIRLLLLGNLISWAVYDYFVLAYLAGISDLFVIISTLIAIYRYDIKKHKVIINKGL